MLTGGSDEAATPSPVETYDDEAAAAAPDASGSGERRRSGMDEAEVVARDSNVRAGPTTSSAVVGSVKRGMRVTVIGRQNNWLHIRIAGEAGVAPREGWLHNSRLEARPGRPRTRTAETE
jgi:uncharacterized protein YgiM (DUF1202 family)